MTEVIGVGVISFVFSLTAVWMICRISHKNSWYDKIDDRKIHTGDVPRLGGVGFSAVFIVVSLLLVFVRAEIHLGIRFVSVFIGMCIILVCGVLDDFHTLASKTKLGIQCIAGVLVIAPLYRFQHLVFFDDNFWMLGWLKLPLSFLWVVGLTNAINFIDGVDGLAGGVSAIIAVTYAVIFASFTGSGSLILFCVCLAASVGGFLVFNLPVPHAKIFMGDGGSQFLGFTLAVLPLLDQGAVRLSLPIPYAAALLLIPILDMVAAVWRRIRDKRPVDSPDKSHIHHKLMYLGCSSWGIDGLLYGLQITLGILVFFAIQFRSRQIVSLTFLGFSYGIAVAFFTIVHFVYRGKMVRRDSSPS
ncbi:MAG: undecaprenyl/decaprenyl-phosphate alpha-N-acetylglucosaminyl 1-phosphate transferase [Spirochaetaceae bacterium]|jgi:UDP-GlcNAc:undecaprenyl-phosphate GlcNAc-1-phosphate transferase|nr:undecaprenyl/decaprenyl-phosphate alpha-N-acetylglucosaminyl 1-phosphate transferase [Spirochaetaceae bacterium]